MRDSPLISLVLLSWNRQAEMMKTLSDLSQQTYPNFEYILVDNCSTDGSSQIAEHFATRDSRLRIHRNSELLDQVDNYNSALEKISSKSTYCKIVQADDFIFKECLTEMVQLAETHSTIAIVSAFSLTGQESSFKIRGRPWLR